MRAAANCRSAGGPPSLGFGDLILNSRSLALPGPPAAIFRALSGTNDREGEAPAEPPAWHAPRHRCSTERRGIGSAGASPSQGLALPERRRPRASRASIRFGKIRIRIRAYRRTVLVCSSGGLENTRAVSGPVRPGISQGASRNRPAWSGRALRAFRRSRAAGLQIPVLASDPSMRGVRRSIECAGRRRRAWTLSEVRKRRSKLGDPVF